MDITKIGKKIKINKISQNNVKYVHNYSTLYE